MSWRRIAVSSVFERMPFAVAVCDANGRVRYVNSALRALLALDAAPWLPRSMASLRGRGDAEDALIRREAARRGSWEGETRWLTATGGSVSVLESVRVLTGGASTCQVHFVQDLTATNKRMQELSDLAYRDGLTGLPNRNLLADRVQCAVDRALRGGKRFALLYLDIDGLKAVNDTAGHAAGDEFVRSVAHALRRALRRRDTIARLGGDEFVVIVEDIEGCRAAARVAEKLLDACRHTRVRGARQPVTASAGISLFPRHGTTMAALLESADAALYRAKGQGRDRFVFAADGAAARAWETAVLR